MYLCNFKINTMKITDKYDETVVSNFINLETGEIIDTDVQIKTHKIIVASKDQFAFMYSSFIGTLKHLTGTDVKLLTYISLKAEYNTNIVMLVLPFLKNLSTELDVSVHSLKASTMRLKHHKIIIPLGSGAYRINPRYYWKGDATNRISTMKFILELECPDC